MFHKRQKKLIVFIGKVHMRQQIGKKHGTKSWFDEREHAHGM